MLNNKITKSVFYHDFPKSFLYNGFCENKWVTLYHNETTYPIEEEAEIACSLFLWTYLAKPEVCQKAIQSYTPDLEDHERSALYSDNHFVSYVKNGFESMITVMSFDEVRPRKNQIRIHEDIIHLLHLYEECISADTRKFIKFNSGEQEEVIIITKNEVKIRHQYLCDFLAAKGMNLVCVIRSEINMPHTLSPYIDCNYKYTGQKGITSYSPTSISNFSVAISGVYLQSWFIGKSIIPYKEFGTFKSSFDSEYAEFIIGYDSSICEDIKCVCSDDSHKYTRVFFKRSVLEKYRDDVNINIDSNRVSSPYFSLKCDLDNVDYIWAYCKDLRCLPFSEQLHWAQFSFYEGNLRPSNFYVSSQTCFNAKVSSPDLIFKERYVQLNRVWEDYFGWKLFKPTKKLQSNALDRVFILGDNEAGHFIKHLYPFNLIVCECINVEELSKLDFYIPKDKKKNLGSVMRLNYFLESLGYERTPIINFCLQLQTLRSELTETHRSDSEISANLQKALDYIQFSFDDNNWRQASFTLFTKANEALLWLITVVNEL